MIWIVWFLGLFPAFLAALLGAIGPALMIRRMEREEPEQFAGASVQLPGRMAIEFFKEFGRYAIVGFAMAALATIFDGGLLALALFVGLILWVLYECYRAVAFGFGVFMEWSAR